VALTAYAGTDDRVRLLRAGFQMHVPKPIEPAELVAAVANVSRSTGKV
jgi:DNA-binding response OmpR family regulator